MAFEIFERPRRRGAQSPGPLIRIGKQLWVNRQSGAVLDLPARSVAIDLLYDRGSGLVGIRLAQGDRPYTLVYNKGTRCWTCGIREFLRWTGPLGTFTAPAYLVPGGILAVEVPGS
jgi:hypothetical protein